MTESVLSARKVRKRFRLREGEVLALKGLDLDVRENEFICIVGPSGCGKSTFLRMAAGLEPVSEGEILYRGQREIMADMSGGRGAVKVIF